MTAPLPSGEFGLRPLARHVHGGFDKSAAEISAFDPESRRLFVVNAEQSAIDVLDLTNPATLSLVASAPLLDYGSKPNSVACHNGLIAVAMSANPKQDPGSVLFLSSGGNVIHTLQVGAEPDMLTFSPDGRWLLTANEGEPTDDYAHDPAGSVSLIDLQGVDAPAGVTSLTEKQVTTLGFSAWNAPGILDPQVRVYGPGSTPAQDLEPEYIAVSPDSTRAWVVLQEANALALVDLIEKQISKIVPLGWKDHSRPENGFDASDVDGGINIHPWPVRGLYQPDSIQAFVSAGETFLVTANEGDHRKFSALNEEVRVRDLQLDATAFPNAAELQRPEQLGQLLVTKTLGDADGDGIYDALYCLGGRSFSIWNADGQLVFDSGSEFERIIATLHPETFNANHTTHAREGRSDDKGPEPEGLTLGEIDGRMLAFIGLERHSGILLYDITEPKSPRFVNYLCTRDLIQTPGAGQGGELGPEGLRFVPASDSPTRVPLLVVTNEVSSSTVVYEVVRFAP